MPGPLVVLDTNVLVSAIRSRRGASFAILDLVGTHRFDVAVSVPLVLEYEDALLRRRGLFSAQAVRDIIDYLCSVARRQEIFFLWRPLLPDPKDDMVAEVAIAAGAEAIVTYNRRDFGGVEKFGVAILSPRDLLTKIGKKR
ncbi:MAG: putative toxin-antitoxin system toxin component, PIN family [Polyangia bacterium]